MDIKTTSRLLIGFGACLLLYGLFMRTTVRYGGEDMVNLHLASRQQAILIFGGVVLVCGVILFGIRKLKQTPEDEAREVARLKVARAAAADGADRAAKGVVAGGRAVARQLIARVRDRWVSRLAIGVLVAFWMDFVFSAFFPPAFATTVSAAFVLYALLSPNSRQAQIHLLWFCAVVTALLTVHQIGMASEWGSNFEALPSRLPLLGLLIVVLAASVIALVWNIRAARREAYV